MRKTLISLVTGIALALPVGCSASGRYSCTQIEEIRASTSQSGNISEAMKKKYFPPWIVSNVPEFGQILRRYNFENGIEECILPDNTVLYIKEVTAFIIPSAKGEIKIHQHKLKRAEKNGAELKLGKEDRAELEKKIKNIPPLVKPYD